MKTEYAPAERAASRLIEKDVKLLNSYPLLIEVLDAVPGVVLIVNEQRQIVFANECVVDMFNVPDRHSAYGLRPGELMSCSHAALNECGCGTTSFCKQCGAVNAILASLNGEQRVDECHILQKETGKAFDLRVYATPVSIFHRDLVIFAVTEINNEKRREALERTFFQDVTSTLSLIAESSNALLDTVPPGHDDVISTLVESVKLLNEQVEYHKQIVLAERGELSVSSESISSLDLLKELTSKFKNSEIGIYLEDKSVDSKFCSDRVLLFRVLSNILKNAIEASQPGDEVFLGCEYYGTKVSFLVTNFQVMSPDIQLQIFNSSFTTKGKGRGLGTYSAKLLTELYLDGQVTFSSNKVDGTTFKVTVPLNTD